MQYHPRPDMRALQNSDFPRPFIDDLSRDVPDEEATPSFSGE
jgi:hypothetical protein